MCKLYIYIDIIIYIKSFIKSIYIIYNYTHKLQFLIYINFNFFFFMFA